MNELKASRHELEQYGRLLCIRIDGVPVAENETSNDVLQNLNQLLKNPAVKYLMLQSTESIKLAKHTLIKHLS